MGEELQVLVDKSKTDFWCQIKIEDVPDRRFQDMEDLEIIDYTNSGQFRIVTKRHDFVVSGQTKFNYQTIIWNEHTKRGCCGSDLDNPDYLFDSRVVFSLDEARRLHHSVLKYLNETC